MDGDKWAEEEEKMMEKMKSLYQNMKEGDQEQKLQNTSGTLRGKETKTGERRVQGVPNFPAYNGVCVKDSELDCPPADNTLPVLCDKYNGGNLEDCFQTCKASFCCTHASKSVVLAPSCANDVGFMIVCMRVINKKLILRIQSNVFSDLLRSVYVQFNCRYWTPCYIAWWKISDTVGPATFPRLPQSDDFFNMGRNYIAGKFSFDTVENTYATWN